MPFVFSHSKYCDMDFVYGFRGGNVCATVVEYWRPYPNQRRPSKGVFKCSPNNVWNWLSSKCLCAVWLNIWENILQMIERSVRIASHIGVTYAVVTNPTWGRFTPLSWSEGSTSWTRRSGSVYGFVQLNKGSPSAIKSHCIHRQSNLYPRWYK